MRLTRLQIDSLPGIQRSLSIERLAPGVNVVLGPNASGKSSLIRALLAILYPSENGAQLVDGRVELVDGGGVTYRGRRLGDSVAWERDGEAGRPPPLPPPHLIGTYVVRLEDLLGAANDEPRTRRGAVAERARQALLDAHIAQRLDRELTGGIDLKAVRKAIGTQAEKGQKLAATLRDAGRNYVELRRGGADLHREEGRLEAAKAELSGVRERASGGHLVADAVALLEALLEVESIEAELAKYPPQLPSLLGNEADLYAKAAAAEAQQRHELDSLAQLLAELERRLAAAGTAPPTVANAELHLDLAEDFVRVGELGLQQERELAGLGARYHEALRRLGGPLPLPSGAPSVAPAVRLDNEALEKLERLLDQRQVARAELHEVRRQLDDISRLVEPDDDDDGLLDVESGVYSGGRAMDGLDSPLRAMRHDLIRWLREPLAETRRPNWGWAVALGLAVVTVAAAAWEVPSGWLAALAGAEVAWLAFIWLALAPPRSPLKARLEADVKALQDITDITLPEEWDHASITNVIIDIDDEIARRENSQSEIERFDRQLRKLTDQSHMAQVRVKALQAQLEAMRREVGYGFPQDIGLTLWLQAAREFESINTALAGSRTELDHLLAQSGELHEKLTSYLDTYDPGAGAQTLDPVALRARCRELLRQAQAHATAITEREGLQRERHRVEAELAARRSQLEEIAERADLTSRGQDERLPAQRELTELVGLLPRWRSTSERQLAKLTLCDELTARLADHEELLAAALSHDRETIEAARLAAAEAVERQQELNRYIHRTERDIENAARDSKLARAAAELRAATDALESHRHVALEMAAGEFLLDSVEAEHEVSSRPSALVRAATWFSKFTAEAFELTFETTAGAASSRRLGAIDRVTGNRLALAELSSGTRAQLLLASRLAFALETEEGGAALPFFLDEALTTSDEQRFKQVAAAVLQVADEDGRQFIYLSARADDADLWQQVAAERGTSVELIQTVSQVA